MSEAYNPPSGNPANEDSLTGAFRAVLQKFLQSTDDMLPAVVIAYDRTKNRATVRPQIMVGTTSGEKVSRAQIASVPVLNIGGGGFVLSFPIKPGDLGWIKASDRDLSLYLQGGPDKEEWPNTRRMHSFQDGLFIPDVLRSFTVAGEDAERVVLQTTDSLTRIAIAPGLVKITTPGTVEVDAPTVHMTGDLVVDGEATIGGIAFTPHTHGGVQAGAAQTDPPTP
jgi:hypothetical protein